MEDVSQHVEVVAELGRDVGALSGAERVELVGKLQRTRCWMNAREAELLAVMHRERDDVDSGAKDLTQLSQQQANVGYGEAKRRALRATWCEELPAMCAALAAGGLGTAHVDELCLLAERLDPSARAELHHSVTDLMAEIAPLTPVQARKRLKAFEASLDDDGKKRLDRQRRENSLRLPKRSDGTVGVTGQLDPVSAEYVRNALDAKVTEMWRREGGGRGDVTPPHQVLTNDQRRAAALVELIRAGATADPATRGRAEIVVLIDHQTLLDQISESPVARLAGGEAIPAAEARLLACDAGIIPAVLGGPSRPLDIGRTGRLATPAQRVALRTVHETCCVTGCDVPFDWCDIHHIVWWRNGGASDLDNLAPVCSKHHRLIHDDAWDLTLDAERVGRLTRRAEPPGTLVGGSPETSIGPPPRGPNGASSPRRAQPRPSSPAPDRRKTERPTPMRC